MKQVIQDVRKGETSVIEVPVPKAGKGMALVRNAASLVSAGTERMVVDFASKSLLGKARSRPDLVRQTLDKVRREGPLTTWDAINNRLDQPMPLGYSSAGTIVSVGEGLSGYKEGDRVACAGGGYAVHAEYALIPQNLLTHLPDHVNFESGAFTTLGAISLHGFRLADPQVGERVAIIGLGLLGLLAVEIVQAAGCSVFGVDPDPVRVDRARSLGATAADLGEAEQAGASISAGNGFDIVLICADTASNDPVALAAALARDRGRVIAVGAVGLDLPRRDYFQKELTFQVSRSYGPGRYDPLYEEKGIDYPIGQVRWTEGRNMGAIVELLAGGKIDVQPLISHRFPIEDGAQAYELIAGHTAEPFLGVLLTYGDETGKPSRPLARVLELKYHSASQDQPVRLGVIGAGNFANAVLLPVLRKVDKLNLRGLATSSGLKSSQSGKRFGFEYAATDPAELIADEKINTIAILTRHHLHAEQTIQALQGGKHVFCEKPLALNQPELDAVFQAQQSSGKLLMVGYNRRFAPMAIKMKAVLDPVEEPLLLSYRVNAGPLPATHWLHDLEQGGGRIIGEGCHFIDFLTFLTDSTPSAVSARGLADGDRYHEDNVVITIEFENGSIGTISYLANGDRAFSKERIEAFGGGRAAVLDDFRSLETFSGGKQSTSRARLRQNKGHLAEWEVFCNAISAGTPPPIPYSHLYTVSQASFAAVESLHHSGRAIPVKLPEEE
jgi:predicted dehydrogenase